MSTVNHSEKSDCVQQLLIIALGSSLNIIDLLPALLRIQLTLFGITILLISPLSVITFEGIFRFTLKILTSFFLTFQRVRYFRS